MKTMQKIILISFLILLNSCITQFIPQISDDKELLVVEGLITDLPDTNIIKLSRSIPLGKRTLANPLKGCIVTISDDFGNIFILRETVDGTYVTDPSKFQGVIGRSYTLHIKTHDASKDLNYESYPVNMIPVPPIDSLYYEKLAFSESNGINSQEGCQVYVNAHDATNLCKFYRWEFEETWEFHLPYTVPNNVCWTSNNSNVINIKNTSVLEEDRINRYPLNFVSNTTERLSVKYSILVNQYSLNEDEYTYWEKLQNVTEQVGGLYDMIPASIPSNVYCLDDPNRKVLGYFSVSANSSKRIFIKESFAGVMSPYNDHLCIADTIYGYPFIEDLNRYLWVIIDHPLPPPGYQVITKIKGCYDCTVRGTTIPPDFWNESK
jgi:Domain of unknown function (DUF4249)